MREYQKTLWKRSQSSRRRSIVLLIVICTVLVFNALILRRNLQAVQDYEKWVMHTHRTMSHMQLLLSDIKDVVGAHRGYLLTQDPIFMERIRFSRMETNNRLVELVQLRRDNPQQTSRLV